MLQSSNGALLGGTNMRNLAVMNLLPFIGSSATIRIRHNVVPQYKLHIMVITAAQPRYFWHRSKSHRDGSTVSLRVEKWLSSTSTVNQIDDFTPSDTFEGLI